VNKFARRTGLPDANERTIIRELEDRGAVVIVLDRPVDLLVGYRGVWTVLEIKNGAKARVRLQQEQFLIEMTERGLPNDLIYDLDQIDELFPRKLANSPVRYAVADEL